VTTIRYPSVYASDALALLCQGVEILAAPLALMLGPTRKTIVHSLGQRSVEFLSDSSIIARRMVQLPERGNNLGAMLLRQTLLEMRERFGDGAATTAVMSIAMLREARKMITAGANPVLMVRGVQLALQHVERALIAQARPIKGPDEVVALATAVTGNSVLGEILGQMFDILGEHATVITEDSPSSQLDYEYIKGGKWDGYLPSPHLLPENSSGLVLHHPLIVLADEELRTLDQVQPMLELALNMPRRPPLLVLARQISDTALATLLANHLRGVLTVGMLILSSGQLVIRDDLNDIAALTGGQVFSEITGYTTRSIQDCNFGRAERVMLDRRGVIIVNGAGETHAIQLRIHEVRAALKHTSRAEDSEWDRLRVRLARLSGGIGVLKLGGLTEQERETQKDQIKKALRALEAAHAGGLVPGGGTALLACIPPLQKAYADCEHQDERYGIMMIEAALKAPFLQIVTNSSTQHPPLALAEVQQAGPDYGFDASRGEYASMVEHKILDSLHITSAALRAAASLASMVMTTNNIVFSA
jgi:chaperonin GroEL